MTDALNRQLIRMTERTQIENLIDRLCELDDHYTERVDQGTLTPGIKEWILGQIDALETTMWNMDMNRDDLEWFANRPIYGSLDAMKDPTR